LYFITRDRTSIFEPTVELLPPGNLLYADVVTPGVRSKDSGVARQITLVPLVFDGAQTIARVMRSFGSGSWIVAGDFGLRMNE